MKRLTPKMIEVLDSLEKGEHVTEFRATVNARTQWLLTGFNHPKGDKVTAAVNGLIDRELVEVETVIGSMCVRHIRINGAGRCVLNNDPTEVET